MKFLGLMHLKKKFGNQNVADEWDVVDGDTVCAALLSSWMTISIRGLCRLVEGHLGACEISWCHCSRFVLCFRGFCRLSGPAPVEVQIIHKSGGRQGAGAMQV